MKQLGRSLVLINMSSTFDHGPIFVAQGVATSGPVACTTPRQGACHDGVEVASGGIGGAI